AYDAAIRFCSLYAKERPAAGFMKTILLRRIGSSVAAGLATTRSMLAGATVMDEEDDLIGERSRLPLTPTEIDALREVETSLVAVFERDRMDPKVAVIVHYLQNRRWLDDHGMIAFSQYYDTAAFVAERLCEQFPGEKVALYAGGDRSFVFLGKERRRADRDDIKDRVKHGEIRLVAATDAACEGLNLQQLGSQVNVDLPWNPSRLEQRKGRIQRIGQRRKQIHVANLRYAGTYEDEVYGALSERFEDIFKVLGQLPDSFEDAWVDAVLMDREAVRMFPARVDLVKSPVEKRYWRDTADDKGLDWESTEKIL
ncbi:MAG: helicase SNF2, partial [Mesorhizobium sp.]